MALISARLRPVLFVPALVSVVVILFSLTPLRSRMDAAVYDLLLGLKPTPPQAPQIVMLDVDDEAIDHVGQWPWPRDIMADGLITLRDLGLRQVIFDIEYTHPSPPGINRSYLDRGLKRDFDSTFGSLTSDVADLFTALQQRQIPLSSANDYASQLISSARDEGGQLYEKARSVALNNDLELGEATAYFQNAVITLNRQSDIDPSKEHQGLFELATQRFSLPFQGDEKRTPLYKDFYIPLQEISSRARWAGLTNVEVDPDGKRRRIRLYENVGGHWYAQLGFAALLHLVGDPQVTVSHDHVELSNAKWPDGTVRNVTIPLDRNGMLLINWQKADFVGSFKHVTFYQVFNLEQREDEIVSRLAGMAHLDAWQAGTGANPAQDLVDGYNTWTQLRDRAKSTGKDADVEASVQGKVDWDSAVSSFLAGSTLDQLRALFMKAGAKLKGENKTNFQLALQNLDESRSVLVRLWKEYETIRDDLRKKIEGKLAFVGWTGTATTDLGANPFQEKYPLVGTHANVVNTILQRQFLTELPSWWAIIATPILAFGLILLLRNLSPLLQNIVGLGIVLAFVAVMILVFVGTGVYFHLVAPTLAMFISFVAFSLVRFLSTEQEKTFLRKAFSTYLSGDVIDEIVTDPGKLKLGGDSKWMTAMFTDVKGFSTISEQLSAEALVHLLNEYLSAMSDIILNERGTIDKYEGDAIIGFFGAPVELPDHAARACLSAIRMRQIEEALNTSFLERQMTPNPLMTRIGINTGEMVVGNMGTERKMNYTIMGNSVNLAARLEGVNKQYGTWILTTEYTAKEAGDDFLFRPLDRVRVVGINTPVRLYNLLGLNSEMGTEGQTLVSRFQEALDLFEALKWSAAAEAFRALSVDFPDDAASKLYAKRSSDFQTKPPTVSGELVFNLTEK